MSLVNFTQPWPFAKDMKRIATAAALLLCLSACSPDPGEPTSPGPANMGENDVPAKPSAPAATSASVSVETAADVLTLEGLGAIRIGEPVPAGSSWASRGAQIPGGCTTISSPDFPGVYAIVEGGKVRRITVGERSGVKLVEGIGTGATEAQVRAAFPGFREEPHKYVDAPAKYLTAPNSASGDPALRFEIGADGRVGLIHVGTMPVLGYVEGCA